MNRPLKIPMLQAALAAVFFGISTPFSKLILTHIDPVMLAALLYLGSGVGLFICKLILDIKGKKVEASLNKKDAPWLIASVLSGGVAAPILLMISLKYTKSSVASLLLNFEGAATALIAFWFFRESISRRIWLAIVFVTIAGIALSWQAGGEWKVSIASIGVFGACIFWGLDNNFTRNISSKDPVSIGIIKGISAGVISLISAFAAGSRVPDMLPALSALGLGCISYGFSIVMFVLAMRGLGAARTGAIFGVAPFIGAVLSVFLLREIPGGTFYAALILMAAGSAILLKESHVHEHSHEQNEHEHSHTHDDLHHGHAHAGDIKQHSHPHIHDKTIHSHEHFPDIHHRHGHEG